MKLILPEILTLIQHYSLQNSNQYNFDNIQCIHCGSTKLWKHGCYFRKSDRDNKTNGSLNPIPIQRFLCTTCKKTCSALPECIPPRRWYLWEIQQLVFILFLAGKSICAIAKETIPSRYTISRWLNNLKIKFDLHKSILCQYFIDLGRTKDFTEFWRNCLKNTTLAKTMLICNFAGVDIP